ncbi:MAG: hypothetical protein ACREX8_20485, partial [Gammaproteobacteria bacterium]
STDLGGGLIYNSFRINGVKRVVRLQTQGAARLRVAIDTDDPASVSRLLGESRADLATSRRALPIVRFMSRRPDAASGVDSATRGVVNATLDKAAATVAQQRLESERAERAGVRSGRVSLALVLGALALSLSALTGKDRSRRPSAIHYAATVMLVASLLAAATVPLL